jgi:signal transduction histidine kinase
MAVVCFGLALLVAVIVAAFLTRRIGGRVAALRAGAQQLARGDLAARITLGGKDEFGELAASFNRMAADLADHQRRLLHTERLASIGQVAAGVAHEINNPLAVIRGYVKVLQRKADAASAETAGIIDEEARRCQRIVEDLLELARPQQLAMGPVDLLEVARDEVERLRNSAQLGDVRISLPPTGDRAPAWGDGEKLRQVLANLLTNAAEAVGTGGTITVSAGVEGDQTLLRIDDDGPGIAPDVLQRVFDPFFTTKDDGVGLGLAISRTIVDAHGGQIGAESPSGGGTRVTVRLPRSHSGAER